MGVIFSGVKRSEHKADHSPRPSELVKNVWSYTSIPNQFPWTGAQVSTGITLSINERESVNRSQMDINVKYVILEPVKKH
jgi:hypothetical protein